MFSPLKKFQTIYFFLIYREIVFFLVKSLKSELYKKWEVGNKFQMCYHNHDSQGNHVCMFLNSSTNSLRDVYG